MAEYVSTTKDPKMSKTVTKHSLSNHALAIEKGFYRQIWLPREDRICSFCTQEVETEGHFLLHCDGITLEQPELISTATQ